MGERVVIDPSKVKAAKEAEPIEYARPDVPRAFDHRVNGWELRLKDWVAAIGGERQLAFALGLAMVLGGLGYGMLPRSESGLWMGMGGLLIGFSVRVPRWRKSRAAKKAKVVNP